MYHAMKGRVMNNILYTFLLACSIFVGGCSRIRQIPEDFTQEKEPAEMIQIRNLTLTDRTLTLNYRVLNPFENSVWVCYDRWVHGEQDVQNTSTRIDGETVWIKLRFNLESVGTLSDPAPVAKYVRLPPGEFHSGKILLNLPIKDYSREWRAGN